MGFSSPKKPLDLADFLSRKGTPRRSRYAFSSRTVSEPEQVDDDETAAISDVTSSGDDSAER